MSSSDKSATAKLPQGKGRINSVLGICANVRAVQLADGSLGNNDHRNACSCWWDVWAICRSEERSPQ
ncbi:MAG: hypothetical protein U7123_08945 [Potamolinea sp.]